MTPLEFEVGIQNETWQLQGSRIFVAKENQETIGFVHVMPDDPQEKDGRIGYIAFLIYTPGYRPVGQALLEKAEEVLTEVGVDEIRTVYGYECHEFGIGGVTHRWPHILGLFGANGYKVTSSALFLIAQDFEVQDPTPPIDCNDLQVRIYYYTGRAPIVSPRVHVFDGEQVVVKHGTESVAHYYPSAQKAAQQLYTFGVNVRKPYRGQGWGRFALQKVLWEARKLAIKMRSSQQVWTTIRHNSSTPVVAIGVFQRVQHLKRFSKRQPKIPKDKLILQLKPNPSQESTDHDDTHYDLSYLWDQGESQSRICTRLVSQRLRDSPTNLLQRDMPRLPLESQESFVANHQTAFLEGYQRVHRLPEGFEALWKSSRK